MQLLALENERYRVTLLPDVGAKILDLIDKRSGHNFLWHNPRIAPQTYPIEANFDNYWCGGWDDGFPTCEACTHAAEQYPNLGELRSVRWTVEANDGHSVALWAYGPISPVKARKTVRLVRNAIEIEFQIEHQGYLPLDYLFGTHPAYSVRPGSILHIPARTGIVGQANCPDLGIPGQRYAWPTLERNGIENDMSRMRPNGPHSAGHYATDLSAGWYAIEHLEPAIGLKFEFPLAVCPYLWLWLSYGGWRGYYLAVVEPWTGCPVTLSDAVQVGTHRVLRPNERFEFWARVQTWTMEEKKLLPG